MKINKFGEMVLGQDDVCDLIMQGREPWQISHLTVSTDVDLQGLIHVLENPAQMITWTFPSDEKQAVPDYDHIRQTNWHMPDSYRTLDIAEYLLELCQTQDQLQRVAQELLMYQERNLFDLLRYLKYLVDIMRQNHVIWGVGRGSSVASYVLYLLGVHKIDSLFYDLDPREFLR